MLRVARAHRLLAAKNAGISSPLMRAARIAINDVLAVKNGEAALIVGNPGATLPISAALYRSVIETGGKPRLLVQPAKTPEDFTEPEVIAALEGKPPVVILILEDKFGKDRRRLANPITVGKRKYPNILQYLYSEKYTRTFFSVRITQDLFERLVPIDYPRLRKEAAELKELFDKAEKIQVTSPSGTNITFSVKGRKASADDGNFQRPGAAGNLPCGETYVCPIPGTAQGVIVYDGSIPLPYSKYPLLICHPIRAFVENGRVVSFEGGGEAQLLKGAILRAAEKSRKDSEELIKSGKLTPEEAEQIIANAYNIGELGVGLNALARVRGISTIEDEKARGTCHFAIGSDYNGEVITFMHLDGVVRNPTITFFFPDGSSITRNFTC